MSLETNPPVGGGWDCVGVDTFGDAGKFIDSVISARDSGLLSYDQASLACTNILKRLGILPGGKPPQPGGDNRRTIGNAYIAAT